MTLLSVEKISACNGGGDGCNVEDTKRCWVSVLINTERGDIGYGDHLMQGEL